MPASTESEGRPVFPAIRRFMSCPSPWEVVYFVHPQCTGTCAHCWSADTFLGRHMPLPWHRLYWDLISADRIAEVRLTGGEPLDNPQLGNIVDLVRSALHQDTTIYIFTSARRIASSAEGSEGVAATVRNMRNAGLVKPGVEVHMSADEHHAGALFRHLHAIRRPPASPLEESAHNRQGAPALTRMARNFIAACQVLVDETAGIFRGGRLKVHVAKGRGTYHRSELHGYMDDDSWNRYVVFSEGLIEAGRARNRPDTVRVEAHDEPTLFIIPGAAFSWDTATQRPGQIYTDTESGREVFLETGPRDGEGACVLGFSNLVAKTFCGGSAVEALKLIGKSDAVEKWRTRPAPLP